VKTAIAVPDGVFERVERKVRALGMSRSEFFTRAAARYLDELDREGLTARIDAAIDASPVGVDEQAEWTRAGLASLEAATSGDEW
jgi:hypothetical protein